VWESRAIRADSFLLIASALDDQQLAGLLALGRQLGMEPLGEVHNVQELARTLAAGTTTGFLYLIARTGVTGESNTLAEDLPAMIRRVRQFTSLRIAAVFGISLPSHVSVLRGIGDAAVVGSTLVAEIEHSSSPRKAMQAVGTRIAELKAAARRGVSRRSSR
jgi:tryptophan synthase alpha subunit